MGLIEKTIFVSYRRTDGAWGLAIFQDLAQHGYDVFIDYDGIASGNFEAVILENIRARAHFLVLLTPTALSCCGDPNDWMRREIEAAVDSQRNIVPLMLEGFDFSTPAVANRLTGKLAALKDYNGLEIPKPRFFSSEMERLRNKFLNVPVDAVLHPASDSAQQVATEQKDKATRAADEQRKRAATERPHASKVRPWLIGGGAVGAYSARTNFERLQRHTGDDTATFMHALYRVAGSKSANNYAAGVYLRHAEELDDAKVADERGRPQNSPTIRKAHDMLDRILVIFDELKRSASSASG
jgi:hypothetical protein